jgi:hypothetical protein
MRVNMRYQKRTTDASEFPDKQAHRSRASAVRLFGNDKAFGAGGHWVAIAGPPAARSDGGCMIRRGTG